VPKGSKTCPKCSAACGPRSFSCKSCGESFIVKGETKTPKVKITRKKKPKLQKVVDWTSLPLGTKFKLSGSSGPYWVDSQGQRTYTTQKGIYEVYSILKDGIMSLTKEGSFNFVYMGDTKASPNVPNLTREAHRIYVRT
jgi:hypothetical protein